MLVMGCHVLLFAPSAVGCVVLCWNSERNSTNWSHCWMCWTKAHHSWLEYLGHLILVPKLNVQSS